MPPSLLGAAAAMLLAAHLAQPRAVTPSTPAPIHGPAPTLQAGGVEGRAVSEPLARRLVAEAAVAQARRMDPAWEERQRDCAGLVRFAYRQAFSRLAPARVAAGLFRDGQGRPAQFADAATLLRGTFALLGRDGVARAALRSGDLAAFARPDDDVDGLPVYHLMLLVVPDDPAHAPALVVYHPGEKGAAVRMGRLDELARDAPAGWRPVPENPLFLGFYRFKEWLQ